MLITVTSGLQLVTTVPHVSQDIRNHCRGSELQNYITKILEYDITLTGYVDQMKIVTLEEAKQSQLSDDPLQSLVDLGRRSASSIVAMFAIGKGSSRQ